MGRDPRFDLLFEPVQIGPVTAPNRFYQVPHCTGMGWRQPKALAAMRGMKAAGGWGVVCTEYCSIHPSSDDLPYPFATLWDDADVRAHRLMTDAVHAHGALAGVELMIGGGYVPNLSTRLPNLAVRSLPPFGKMTPPQQSRRIDKADIRDIRKWHRAAAARAIRAGFDIVYVYAAHGYLLSEFMDPEVNDRSDEYGGSLTNRLRLVRELIEETREAVAGKAAVAVRFAVTDDRPESYEAFAQLAEAPDLWDLTIDDYSIEMGSSRFVAEGPLVASVAKARAMTSKPVVAVGRFTSPDTMAQVIRAGAQDLIGAARPSIADPFLPLKIAEGREDEIRECIGCNICYASNSSGVSIRCTQNPTMGEEWRMNWHPEYVPAARKPAAVLVVGAGPAGLEAARVLGRRGHKVLLAEAGRELGGRAIREARLPGLAEWRRVADWRLGRLDALPNVEIYPESRMGVADIQALDVDHVLIAAGARWSVSGIGRRTVTPFARDAAAAVVSVDTVIDAVIGAPGAALPKGRRVLIYDDDHYYIGPVLALAIRAAGYDVTLASTLGVIAAWTEQNEEQERTIQGLVAADVGFALNVALAAVTAGGAEMACTLSGARRQVEADWVVPVTSRTPEDALYYDLLDAETGLSTLRRIGDCDAPGAIVAAVYSGHRAAMELGEEIDEAAVFARREHPPVGL